jgi:hypothetical protein
MTNDDKPGPNGPNLSMATIPDLMRAEIREGTPTSDGPGPEPAGVPVDDLITDSLRAAVVLQRPPTISSLLGVPVQRIESPSTEPLGSLADQIPPSERDAPAAADANPELEKGRSRALLWVFLSMIAAGVVIAVLLR